MHKLKGKRAGAILVLSVLVTAMATFGYLSANSGSEPEIKLLPVSKGTISIVTSADGRATIDSITELDFAGAGTIAEIYVTEGQAVGKGQELAKLDSSLPESQLKQAKASLTIAKENLSKLRAGATTEETAVLQVAVDSAATALEAARRKLVEVQNQGTQDAAAAQVAVDNARTTRDFTLGVREVKAKEYLDLVNEYEHPIYHLPNYTAQQEAEVEAALAAADAALNIYLAAENSLKTALESQKAVDLKKQASTQAAQDAVNLADSQHQSALAQLNLKKAAPRLQDTRVASAQVVQAEGAVEIAETAVDEATVRAPIDGTVMSINRKLGETAGGQGSSASDAEPFMVIGHADRMTIEAQVEEIDIPKISVGQKIMATFDALEGDEFSGTVEGREGRAKIDQNGVVTYPVRVSVDNKKSMIKDGMTAHVDFIFKQARDVLIIPVKTVTRTNGKSAVMVKESKEKLVVREIELGITDGSYVEVKRGLSLRENVVIKEEAKKDQ